MKKKENLWDLLTRLDEEASQYSFHLSEANRYFDKASAKTSRVMQKHEKHLHTTIQKARRSLAHFLKGNKRKA